MELADAFLVDLGRLSDCFFMNAVPRLFDLKVCAG
jgi:hypothetical protein